MSKARFYSTVSCITWVILSGMIGFSPLAAEEVTTGSKFPLSTLVDQHEKEYTMSGKEKLLIFMAEMEASKIIHAVAESRGDSFLKKHATILLADIHRMPSLISSLIAKPRMRDYTYTIYLIEDDTSGSTLPRKPGQLTLMYLENNLIKKIEYVDSPGALLKSIEAVQP